MTQHLHDINHNVHVKKRIKFGVTYDVKHKCEAHVLWCDFISGINEN
jgi:hypothetical protein